MGPWRVMGGVEERGQRVTQVSAKSHEGRNKVQGLGGPCGPEAAADSPAPRHPLWWGSVERDLEVGGGHIALTSLFPPDPCPSVTFVFFHQTEVFPLRHGDGSLAGSCWGVGWG